MQARRSKNNQPYSIMRFSIDFDDHVVTIQAHSSKEVDAAQRIVCECADVGTVGIPEYEPDGHYYFADVTLKDKEACHAADEVLSAAYQLSHPPEVGATTRSVS